MATKADVAAIARQAVAQRQLGDATWEHNGVVFDLNAGGYCARFVRQCHDAALGQGEWAWAFKSPTAWDMEIVLRAAGLRTDNPQPGDIVCVNGSGVRPGHIAIFLGDGQIAENTSNGTRGAPSYAGTKLTPISAVASRITGYYACLPPAELDLWTAGQWAVQLPNGQRLDAWLATQPDTHVIVALRPVAEGLGYRLDTDPHARLTTIGGK